MMRSLYSGVSGLKNHQTRMDVIGNNISNVNTHGFKRGRALFQSLISQRITGAARPNEVRGGINPKQVGLGVQISTIDTIHTQGSLQTTGVNTDVAIVGQGFFVEQDETNTIYSRAGAFSLDAEGTLVNPANGYRVQGYQGVLAADGVMRIDTSSAVDDIVVPLGEKIPARETQIVNYRSNLNKLTPIIPPGSTDVQIQEGTWRTSIKVYDSRGDTQEVQLNFTKTLDVNAQEIPNLWRVVVNVFDAEGNEIEGVQAAAVPGDISNDFFVRFNTSGAIEAIIDPNLNNPNRVNGVDGQRLEVQLGYQVPGSVDQNIALDFGTSGRYDGITQFASTSSTKAFYQDGYAMGYLEDFAIDDEGVIVGTYTNGIRRDLAQLALANFKNPGGMEKVGDTYFQETNNSGPATVTPAAAEAAGKIRAGAIEMSNVDLANEFTDMIVTQRGFQANSRSITTSDTMLEELLRLKR